MNNLTTSLTKLLLGAIVVFTTTFGAQAKYAAQGIKLNAQPGASTQVVDAKSAITTCFYRPAAFKGLTLTGFSIVVAGHTNCLQQYEHGVLFDLTRGYR